MNRRRSWPKRLFVASFVLCLLGLLAVAGAFVLRPQKFRTAYRKARWKITKVLHPPPPAGPGTRPARALVVAEPIWEHGLRTPLWSDFGWTTRELAGPELARLRFDQWGGWILARREKVGDIFGGLVIRMRAPKELPEFLEVTLSANDQDNFPSVNVGPEHRRDLEGGWTEIFLPMRELNPFGLAMEKIVLRARLELPPAWIEIDRIGLTEKDASAPPPAPLPVRDVAMTIDCRQPARRISPLIYGVASADAPRELGATAYRWGGNPASRYNWQLSAYNTGIDWFFQNVHVDDNKKFFDVTRERGAFVALTLPMLGWVAKDATSASFPVSVFGPQKATDPQRPDFGNGERPDGKPIPPGPPTRTSVAASPEFIAAWVRAIRQDDVKRGARSVHEYILDNEPALWSSTHRDVHPAPLTYDELLERTIRYGTAVRQADPDAILAGPAEWGWPAYFYSAKDAAEGFALKPDRRAHDDVPLLAWYLRKLREHEELTGVRVLDVLDVHFYPAGADIYGNGGGGGTDVDTAARRYRATRSLWDATYTDESWINDKVNLLPRLRALVAENYPGRGISIGEWSFGAEGHQSGGLAMAEALGRFAQEGLTSAFYWIVPKTGSPAYWGFRAYRNFDGNGGHFLDLFVPATAGDEASLFASRDESGTHVVAIALNFSGKSRARLKVDASSCGRVVARRTLTFYGKPEGLAPLEGATPAVEETVEPSSITVFDLTLAK